MKNHGQIEVVCGPMFAGKTEELIRRIRRLSYAKQSYLVFKPQIDQRYSTDQELVSHNLTKEYAHFITQATDILPYIQPSTQVIIIDEVQFLDEKLISIVEDLANQGKRIILGGLDLDFRGEPFGIMPLLLSRAEVVTKLTAICMVCGEPATRTQRLLNGLPASSAGPTIAVGAKESYQARCRCCHEVKP
jgi:thymidine kinase